MRQSIKAAGLASLLLLSLTDLSAEPLVKGFFVEKLPANSLSRALMPGKGLVLAHVLNQSNEGINTGSYQVGVQIEDKGAIKTYSLTPRDSITPGALKTFRMAVPVDGIDKATGRFRVFSRINGVTTWSENYSFLQGVHSSADKNGVTTLYMEAPSLEKNLIRPEEVPFENESSSKNDTLVETSSNKTVEAISANNNAEIKKTVQKIETKVNVEKAKVDKSVEKTEQSVKKVATTKTEVASTKMASESKPGTKSKTSAEALKQLEEKKVADAAKAAKSKKSSVATVESKATVTRKINPSEFKKLRTMDEELIIYVIKEGDTLKSISENYYGTSSKERTIADLNFIEKSSAVRVGEEIIVEVRPLGKRS